MIAATVSDVLEGRRRWCVTQGDCIEALRTIPDESVDSIVTDPPAGISFMGKAWDGDKGGRDQWIAWLAERMREAFRALKPGGYALVWALPRTSHWTAMALEDAGFEIRDRIEHIFGSGFPKSLDVSKAIDKLAGAERPVIGEWDMPGRGKRAESQEYGLTKDHGTITAPATPEAAARHGWGTALKPSCEDWWLVRKPFRGSVAKNVLAHGTGAINIDGCRVPHASAADFEHHAAGVAAIKARGGSMENSWANHSDLAGASDATPLGRWPSHLLLTHSPGCERIGTRRVKAHSPWAENDRPPLFTGEEVSPVHHSDGDGYETIEHWQCVEGCPVALLDEQSGVTVSRRSELTSKPGAVYGDGAGLPAHTGVYGFDDEGGASRYFTTFAPFIYSAKADKTDREKGCEYLPKKTWTDGRENPVDHPKLRMRKQRRNHHPTVKSTDLMRWLVRLITPPRGIVLDLFTGSGSTGVACSAEGFGFIGIELDPEYAEIARARITGDAPLFNMAGGLAESEQVQSESEALASPVASHSEAE